MVALLFLKANKNKRNKITHYTKQVYAMKKTNISILFLDNTVASKEFACHFLNYDVYCSEPFTFTKNEKTILIPQYTINQKHKQVFNIIVCFNLITEKEIQVIKDCSDVKSVIITNNITTLLLLKQNKINCCFVELPDVIVSEKITIKSNEELYNLPDTITIKVDIMQISKLLAKHIVNASVGSVCLLKKKTAKQICFSLSERNHITQIIAECIKITNSNMLTVEKFHNLNFYSYLSGKGFVSVLKRHFKLITFLCSLKNQTYNYEEVLNSLTELSNMNYNKYINLNILNNIINKLNTKQGDKNKQIS